MSATYVAVVKYPLHASREEKVTALRNGLTAIAMELVEEHRVPLDDVLDWLTDAETNAAWSAEYVEGGKPE